MVTPPDVDVHVREDRVVGRVGGKGSQGLVTAGAYREVRLDRLVGSRPAGVRPVQDPEPRVPRRRGDGHH